MGRHAVIDLSSIPKPALVTWLSADRSSSVTWKSSIPRNIKVGAYLEAHLQYIRRQASPLLRAVRSRVRSLKTCAYRKPRSGHITAPAGPCYHVTQPLHLCCFKCASSLGDATN